MTTITKSDAIPITCSSGFLRRPLSMTSAYTPRNQRNFFHAVGAQSVGQAVGRTVEAVSLIWLLNDLIRHWGEGHFWKRFGLVVATLGGGGISLATKPVKSIFEIDLFATSASKINDRLQDLVSNDSVKKKYETTVKQAEKAMDPISKRISRGGRLHLPNLRDLQNHINKILNPVGVHIVFDVNRKGDKANIFVHSVDQFTHEESNPGATYQTVLALPQVPIEDFIGRILGLSEKMNRSGKKLEELIKFKDQVLFSNIFSRTLLGYLERSHEGKKFTWLNDDSDFIHGLRHYFAKKGKEIKQAIQQPQDHEIDQDSASKVFA